MKDLSKYRGIFPAFYACYDEIGAISPEHLADFVVCDAALGLREVWLGGEKVV